MTAPWIIVQARTGSHRLPDKVLADLCGRQSLAWLLERVRSSERAAGLIVATTTEPGDDRIVSLCESVEVPHFRGHPTDVLGRYRAAAEEIGAEGIVRISADCPFLHHQVVDVVIEAFQSGDAELVQNHRDQGWPFGTAVEVMTSECLARLDERAIDSAHREHVTLYAYEHADEFSIEFVPAPEWAKGPDLLFCLDTPEDLRRLRSLCSTLDLTREPGLEEVIRHARRVSEAPDLR